MYNTLLQTDFYKATHLMQFDPKVAKLTSYLTPRGSRLTTTDKMVWFGISGFANKYLKDFQPNFFDKDWDIIVEEYHEVLEKGLGYSPARVDKTLEKVKELYDLSYLPIKIRALPEGTLVPMGVPALEISTTIDGFAWVGQAIESLLSCSIWHPCVSATVAYEYAKIAKKAYEKTVDDGGLWKTAMCDFSLRGQESNESAVASSAAWLTAFYNSSTVHARNYIMNAYPLTAHTRIGGLTSTEHSVMTSDYAIHGDERETYRRLLTEVYPDVSFAAVCDSYDFWEVLTNVLPSLRDEIEAHEGFLGVRHDSAEPVAALCGIEVIDVEIPSSTSESEINEIMGQKLSDYLNNEDNIDNIIEQYGFDEFYLRARCNVEGKIYDNVYVVMDISSVDDKGHRLSLGYIRPTTWQDKGMVETIYELFGGTTNSKGYKIVNPKLKAVYGDSITIPRAKEIYRRLEAKGFAASNVSLGVGSFSMEAVEEQGQLKPFTRDTFSIAIKATYGVLNDGTEIEIYKDPKGFSLKKSLRGLCTVYDDNGKLVVVESKNMEEKKHVEDFLTKCNRSDAYITYFDNSHYTYFDFNEVRETIDNNLKKEDK